MNLLLVLFAVSGATSLIGEVVWMRALGLVVGNSVWAAAAVVTAWMVGLALGGWLGGRLAPGLRRHLRVYAAAEVGVALFYLASPELLPRLQRLAAGLTPDLSGHLLAGMAGRFLLSVVVLLPPTCLMGLTLPVLAERARGSRLAGTVGTLYGVNTLGAVAGVLLAAYLLLPTVGGWGALAVAALAAGVVAAAAVLLERRLPAPEKPEPGEDDGIRHSSPGHLLLVAAMGGAALSAELAWVRILVLHLGSRVYAFSLMLAVYLLGIGLGGTAVRALGSRLGHPRRLLAGAQLWAAGMLLVTLLPLSNFGGLMAWIGAVLHPRLSFAGLQTVELLAVAVVVLPVTLFFGASFPLAVAADPAQASAGRHTGRVAAANTAGAVAGAVLTPMLLLPLLGVQRTLLLLALGHVGIAVVLRGSRRWLTPLVLGASAVAAGLVLPPDLVLRAAVGEEPGARLVALDESLTATVLVRRYEDARGSWFSLELNGVNVAGSSPELLAIQQLQGQVPLLQTAEPRRVLHIGFGSGGTCWAVSRHPVQRIDVVEIAPEVLAVSDRYFAGINHHVLADPRVHTIINDGRNYLLATDEHYDAILSDSIHPVYAGNSTLYTLEYFQMCRNHLRPGGVVSMWLPLYSLSRESFLQILSAFSQVFPGTVVWYDTGVLNEFTVVTGRVDPGPIEVRWDELQDPALAPSLAIAGVHRPEDLGERVLLGPDEVGRLCADVPPHVDDLPTVEYRSGRILARERSWLANFVLLVQNRRRTSPFVQAPFDWQEARRRRDRRLGEHLRQLEARITASR